MGGGGGGGGVGEWGRGRSAESQLTVRVKINYHYNSKRYKGIQIVEQARVLNIWSGQETAAQTDVTEQKI